MLLRTDHGPPCSAARYGLSYLCKLHGSLLPRVLPAMLVAGLLSALTALDYIDYLFGLEPGMIRERTFDHPYAFQLFGLVFGYLTVARLNWSYNRSAAPSHRRRQPPLPPS